MSKRAMQTLLKATLRDRQSFLLLLLSPLLPALGLSDPTFSALYR